MSIYIIMKIQWMFRGDFLHWFIIGFIVWGPKTSWIYNTILWSMSKYMVFCEYKYMGIFLFLNSFLHLSYIIARFVSKTMSETRKPWLGMIYIIMPIPPNKKCWWLGDGLWLRFNHLDIYQSCWVYRMINHSNIM